MRQVNDYHGHTKEFARNEDGDIEQVTGPDWEAIENAISGEPIEQQLSFSDASAAWAIMLDWLCKSPGNGGRGPHVLTIAMKALGLQLWLSPEACFYSSMEEIAEALGCSKQAISKHIAELRDQLDHILPFKKTTSRYSEAQQAALAAGCHSSDVRRRKKSEQAERISLEAVAD
jgi:HTH domain